MLVLESELKRIIQHNSLMIAARDYLNNDYIEELEVVHIGYDHFYSIKVLTHSGGKTQTSFIALSEKGIVRRHHCDCLDHRNDDPCVHVASTLIQVQHLNPKTYPFYYKRNDKNHWHDIYDDMRKEFETEEIKIIKERSDLLVNLLQEDSLLHFKLEENLEKVKIEASLSIGTDIQISFKVGREVMYVIPDLKEFLRLVATKGHYEYGKFLNLEHDIENFDIQSQRQIKFMNHLLSEQMKFQFDLAAVPKTFLMGEPSLDFLFETYLGLGPGYCNFNVVDHPYPFPVEVLKNDDNEYEFSIPHYDEDAFVLGKNHAYFIYEAEMSRYKLDSYGKAKRLLSEVHQLGKVIITEDRMPDFVTYVLDDLKSVIRFEGVSFDEFKQVLPQLQIYGDVNDEGWVTLRIEAINHGFKIPGFSDHQLGLLKQLESNLRKFASHISGDTVLFDPQDLNTDLFLSRGLVQLNQIAQVFVSETLAKMNQKQAYDMKVGVNLSNNLLEMNFSSDDIPMDQLAEVLASYRLKKKFHRLKDGTMLALESDALKEMDDMFHLYELDPSQMHDGQVLLPSYRLFSIDEQANHTSDIEFQKSELFEDVIRRFETMNKADNPIPEHYAKILRDYQLEGFQWFRTLSDYGFGGILADDMGLGKTVQTISVLDSMIEPGKPSIVVCPSSILLNWVDEIEKFAPHLKHVPIMGVKEERQEIIKTLKDFDVVITSYDYLRRDIEDFEGLQFNAIILDEAQYIKNSQTLNARSVKQLNGSHRFALSGTPIENTLAELWSIFDFLMPGYLYSYAKFATDFERPIVQRQDQDAQLLLKQLIEPFILRRMKKDVLKELPDKIEKTIKFEFSPEEKGLYQAHLALVNDQLKGNEQQNSIEVLAMLTRLRQICNEPRVLFENIPNSSSKMLGALDLIETLRENKQKILLFSSFTTVLDLMAGELDQRGITYTMLTGQTSREDRRQRVNDFQSDDTEVFLISLKAGGTGINLTSAEAVIHFDPWWNVSAQNQATDRAYRIGQKNNVQVFKLIMKDSVEEKIIELQEQKQDLFNAFVENNQGTITKMSRSDIIALFAQN